MNNMAWRKRRSLFSDKLVTENSLASCLCDLYIPEPELKFNEAGVVNEICLSGENQTLLWSRRCVIHLCEIPFVPSDFVLTLDETGQDSKICLNVTLNRHKKGELQYFIKERLWHEYKQKTGTKWRKFFLRFDDTDPDEFTNFQEKLVDILSLVETEIVEKCTYMLVAIQVPKIDVIPKPNVLRKSISDTNRESVTSNTSVSSTRDLSDSELDIRSSDPRSILETPIDSILAPFDLAPWVPAEVDSNKSAETIEYHQVNEKPNLHKNEITTGNSSLCDSLHIHPDELPSNLDSILNSTGSGVLKSDASGYYEKFNSEYLLTEDLYMPMGVQQNMAAQTTQNAKATQNVKTAQNVKLHDATIKTAQLLQTAINDGAKNHAKEYAAKLAGEDVLVTIDVKPKQVPEKDQEFILKVYLEDKETSGGSITLQVKPMDTIRDLKNRMLMKHMFPVEVQSWIIGKRIPADTETLAHCRVKSTGHSAFLYLSSAKSAGLNQEEFQERWAKMFTPVVAGQPIGFLSPQGQDMKITNGLIPPATPATAGSRPVSMASPTPPPSAQKDKPPVQKRPSPKPATKPGVNIRQPIVQVKKSSTGKEIKDILGQLQGITLVDSDFNDFDVDRLLGSGDGSGFTQAEMPYEEAPAGWACSACTYINQPTRPGCEVCANPRPADYNVPDEYVISEEEKQRLKRESLLEKQAQSIVSPERLHANHAERDLDNLLKFQDALHDTLQRHQQNPTVDPASGQSSSPFVAPLFRRNPGGEVHSEEEDYPP